MTIWLNDEFVPEAEARISPADRGFLYGDGLFETMRAQDGSVFRLGRHLERLREGLRALRITVPDTTEQRWQLLTATLLVKNNLGRGTASVKIVVSRGTEHGLGLPGTGSPTVLARAEHYEPPSPAAYRSGWRLHVTAGGFPHAVARHKSLSYLRMLAARQEALDAGADEALVVDTEGSAIETAAGSLLVLGSDGWVRVDHPGRLAGLTVQEVSRLLGHRGAAVSSRRVAADELTSARAVWVLNSLIGIMPVRGIDDAALPETQAQLADELRAELFRTG